MKWSIDLTILTLEKLGIDGPNKGKFIIVLCSKWCQSCKLLAKKLESFKDERGIELKEIDISEYGALARDLKITAIPALIFFEDGKLINKDLEIYGELLVQNGVMIGSFNEKILREIIEKI
ncbi:MAG: thioredoxin [Promethearchaeota archaeon]|nr:MAG: thioredoxin [Candidatus Lokiarchaeota archaeon]